MKKLEVAVYARVSSEQQAETGTVESQLAALAERVTADGHGVSEEFRFIDEGYSGATLVRPALERLRDQVAAGTLDRVYVHSPDRLARKYAYQVLLVDECRRAGVEVVFLNRELGQSPEDDLLLQVQGMVAEYERAKILERSRRGKRHSARQGSLRVFSGAPYGYRYVGKSEGHGEGRWEIVLEEAQVVRKIFDWVGLERATIGEVCRRLGETQERTRGGKTGWNRTTVWGMLKNPAYKGTAAFGKTRVGPLRPRLRPQRGKLEVPRRGTSTYYVPPGEWILVPVPPIVSEAVFEAVQQQLAENRNRARQRRRGARYLLQGLLTCKRCGYAYYGKAVSLKAAKGRRRDYAYYRCTGTDAYRFGGERVCRNKQVRTDLLDRAVWEEVRHLLEDPTRVEEEYHRRLHEREGEADAGALAQLQARIGKLRRGVARLIDSYAEGFIEKGDFEPRVTRMKERLAGLREEAKQTEDRESQLRDLRLVVGRIQDFAAQVTGGLDEMDWRARRKIIRTLVKRVEVDENEVTVSFRVGMVPFAGAPGRGLLPDCWRRDQPAAGQHLHAPLLARLAAEGQGGAVRGAHRQLRG